MHMRLSEQKFHKGIFSRDKVPQWVFFGSKVNSFFAASSKACFIWQRHRETGMRSKYPPVVFQMPADCLTKRDQSPSIVALISVAS